MISTIKILVVSGTNQACGIYQYGEYIMHALGQSRKYEFIKINCDDLITFSSIVDMYNPAAIIYNFHTSTLAWAQGAVTKIGKHIKHIMIYHEGGGLSNIDATITLDPYTKEEGSIYNPGWFILDYMNRQSLSNVPIFGSFGFAFPGKGFERIINLIQDEFDEAVIRLGIAYAKYGDESGTNALATANYCKSLIKKPNISLEISHELLAIPELLTWLGQNNLNLFLYDTFEGRGVSSVPIYALSSKRPLALTRSHMFRQMFGYNDSAIFIENKSLQKILEDGVKPLEPFYENFSLEKFVNKYENRIDRIIT